MNPIRLSFLFLLFQLGTFGISAQTNVTPDNKTVNYLDSFRLKYTDGILKGNFKNVLDQYSATVRLMPEFQKTVLGKPNATLYYEAFFNRFSIPSYNKAKIEILDLDSMVVELGYLDMTIVSKKSKQKYDLKGKYQNIWKKSTQGNLSLVAEAWNYNHAIDFSDQLRFEEVPSVQMAFQQHLPVKDNISWELAALNALMENAIVQRDAKIWAQFFADDGMFIYSFNPIYQGRKVLDEYIDKHAKELPVFEELDIRNDQVDDLKNGYVIEYATHIANWKTGDYSGISTGKNIRIWRREQNGTLKIIRQMAMYD